MTERAYCRVYYSIKDDLKFETIRDDDHHLATWLRLLMSADAIWPASPDLPAAARRASVKALVSAELVDLLPGGRYRIHGLDNERGARQEAARSSAAHRSPSERSPNAKRTLTSHSEPSRAEPNRAEPSTPPARRNGMEPLADVLPRVGQPPEAFDVSPDEARVFGFIALFGASVRPESKLGTRLLGLIERRGVEEVLRRASEMAKANGSMSDRQWVLGLENAIEQVPTGKEAREEDAAEDARKRSERVQADMARRRAERERWVTSS